MKALKWLRKGEAGTGSGIMTLGIIFLVLVFFAVIMEIGNIYLTYSGVESKIQRAANTTVEYSMMDNYRADGILRLDVTLAQATLKNYLRTDLGIDASGVHRAADGSQQYKITFSTTEITQAPPAIKLVGDLQFNTIFALFTEAGTLSFHFEITSRNYTIR